MASADAKEEDCVMASAQRIGILSHPKRLLTDSEAIFHAEGAQTYLGPRKSPRDGTIPSNPRSADREGNMAHMIREPMTPCWAPAPSIPAFLLAN